MKNTHKKYITEVFHTHWQSMSISLDAQMKKFYIISKDNDLISSLKKKGTVRKKGAEKRAVQMRIFPQLNHMIQGRQPIQHIYINH